MSGRQISDDDAVLKAAGKEKIEHWKRQLAQEERQQRLQQKTPQLSQNTQEDKAFQSRVGPRRNYSRLAIGLAMFLGILIAIGVLPSMPWYFAGLIGIGAGLGCLVVIVAILSLFAEEKDPGGFFRQFFGALLPARVEAAKSQPEVVLSPESKSSNEFHTQTNDKESVLSQPSDFLFNKISLIMVASKNKEAILELINTYADQPELDDPLIGLSKENLEGVKSGIMKWHKASTETELGEVQSDNAKIQDFLDKIEGLLQAPSLEAK